MRASCTFRAPGGRAGRPQSAGDWLGLLRWHPLRARAAVRPGFAADRLALGGPVAMQRVGMLAPSAHLSLTSPDQVGVYKESCYQGGILAWSSSIFPRLRAVTPA